MVSAQRFLFVVCSMACLASGSSFSNDTVECYAIFLITQLNRDAIREFYKLNRFSLWNFYTISPDFLSSASLWHATHCKLHSQILLHMPPIEQSFLIPTVDESGRTIGSRVIFLFGRAPKRDFR